MKSIAKKPVVRLGQWTGILLLTGLAARCDNVKLETNPSGAKLKVNGQEKGITPVSLDLTPGKDHLFEITKDGYLPYSGKLKVRDNKLTRNIDLPTHFVTAQNGLVMREKPTTDADRVRVVGYLMKLRVLEEKEEAVTIGQVTGKWVKTRYKGKTGWMFGGYLSKDLGEWHLRRQCKKDFQRFKNGKCVAN